jgi:hypothetical protein
MKNILLIILAISCLSFIQDDKDIWTAGQELITRLKNKAPKHDGVSLRSYSYEDLNYDGAYEIIEKINNIEEVSTGFLNGELYPAFEFHKIYKFKDGKFTEATSGYSNYLYPRIIHYEFWKKQIQNPINLSNDSKSLIEHNKEKFLAELNRLIAETKKLDK